MRQGAGRTVVTGEYRIRVAAAQEEGGDFSSYSVSPNFEARSPGVLPPRLAVSPPAN